VGEGGQKNQAKKKVTPLLKKHVAKEERKIKKKIIKNE
jgi:hypothetical protein